MARLSWTTLRRCTRPNRLFAATRKLRLPRTPVLQFTAVARPHTHTNAASICLASVGPDLRPSPPSSLRPSPPAPCHGSLRLETYPAACGPCGRHTLAPGACASKACPSTSPRRSEVRGRTPKGRTARHAAAAPVNRSFGSGNTFFPYIPQATACCNHFVMSLSQFPSIRHLVRHF